MSRVRCPDRLGQNEAYRLRLPEVARRARPRLVSWEAAISRRTGTGEALKIETLKKRAEFLRLRGGARHSGPCCVLECKPALPERTADSAPRFGFTVTKKLGNAVMRNRIRRRLKAALCLAIPGRARAGFDYVVVARPAAANQPFPEMVKELELAFGRVHHPRGARGGNANVASNRAKPSRAP